MTRRSWANEAQRAWLVAQTKFFIEARDSGTISDWRARAFQEWFDKFPEPEPTEQQIQAAKGSVKDAKDRNTTARKTVSHFRALCNACTDLPLANIQLVSKPQPRKELGCWCEQGSPSL